MKEDSESDIILVFGDDWGRHPSSSQHLIGTYRETHQIIWVNSIGMRSPKFSLQDLKRVFDRVKGLAPSMPRGGNLHEPAVINPHFLPFHSFRTVRAFNKKFIGSQIKNALPKAYRSLTIWVSNPLAGYLLPELPRATVIYYCGDDFRQFSSDLSGLVADCEERLFSSADLVAFASETLLERYSSKIKGEKIHLRHGVDCDHFQPSPRDTGRVGYFGILSEWIDLSFFAEVARLGSDIEFVLIGDDASIPDSLRLLTNVKIIGKVPFDQLPDLAKQLDVGLLLYKKSALTEGITPLKLYEYFALGIPVVSTMPFDWVSVGNTPNEYLAEIRSALEATPDECEALRSIAESNSWDARRHQLDQALSKLIPD